MMPQSKVYEPCAEEHVKHMSKGMLTHIDSLWTVGEKHMDTRAGESKEVYSSLSSHGVAFLFQELQGTVGNVTVNHPLSPTRA